MGKVKLGDIFEIGSGGTPSKRRPEYYQGNIPWVKTGDLKKKYLYEVEGFISKEGLDNSSAKMYDEDTVLIAMYGATIGAASILKTRACTNQACAAFKPNEKVVPEYLYYFLKSRKERFISDGVGGAQPNISSGYLKKVEMEIPTIIRQKEIIKILDDIYDIIEKRKQESIQLDNLIQSRFVEMFGDPVQNTKGWSIDTCKNLTSKIGSGATPKGGRESYCTEGIAFVRSMNVYNNRFEYGDLAFINDEQANKLSNVMVQHKDVLLNITGASVARCCIVPDELIPARVNQHVAIVRCKEKILPEFLCSMFTEDNYQKLLWRIATSGGATREAITKQQIENLVLIVPPMKLQEDYVRFSERVNKSKFVIHKFLYCTTHNTQSIIKPRPNTKESGKTRGGKPYADEF